MVTCGNALQIAPNHAKLRKKYGNACGNMLNFQ